MIIGNGLIAKEFKKKNYFHKNKIIFASGVSNSNNIKIRDFNREIFLIKKILNINTDLKFYYFSTIDVLKKRKTPYIKHKIKIEKILVRNKNTIIIRLPQVVGVSKNKNTIFNYLKNKISKNRLFKLYSNCFRNFIDVADITKIILKISKLKKKDKIYNLFYKKSIEVENLVTYLETLLQRKAKYNIIDIKDYFYKDLKNINFGKNIVIKKKNYYQLIFKKYV